ncbi:glycoside hydrolase family 16 protein [Amycolatopsis sp. ATCC 39116]|uniref:glycoside hydrolase family 16 protein n=1 Tax=Amycolatopsis sp. (strain ATCC 39116 / 75iv2) TaxID=385957 RepID=UPI0002626E57|nr:glycoside hydrolase family 16 protein [Amycolatopsis sp. ATCC 39116]
MPRYALVPAVLVAAALVTAPAAVAAGPVTTPAGSGYTLVFSDEFNDSTVDTAKWNYRTDQKVKSAQLPANVTEGGGVLTLNLRKEQVGSYAYTAGGVVSKQSFRYGYYETRAKTPVGSGWHTSFWAMAGDGSTTFNPDRRTEIDQFEINSSAPRSISQGVNAWRPDGTKTDVGRKWTSPGFDTSAGWHTYGFDWNESRVAFYVDGVLTNTATYPPSLDTHDYVNIWLTSIAYETVDESKLPATAQFDYVRYYQREYYVDNDTPADYGYSETGTWLDSSLAGFTVGNSSRYSQTPGSTATWRPNLRAGGTYDVWIYRVPSTDSAARLTVVHNGQTSTVTADYTTGGWLKLGTWDFPAGTSSAVTLTAGAATARADAVKFLPAG